MRKIKLSIALVSLVNTACVIICLSLNTRTAFKIPKNESTILVVGSEIIEVPGFDRRENTSVRKRDDFM